MQTRRVEPRFYVFLSIVLLLIFVSIFCMSRISLAAGCRSLAEAEARRNALAETISERKETLSYRQSDDYVERVARDELNMLLPGEYRYQED